jgi:hypothetical protein
MLPLTRASRSGERGRCQARRTARPSRRDRVDVGAKRAVAPSFTVPSRSRHDPALDMRGVAVAPDVVRWRVEHLPVVCGRCSRSGRRGDQHPHDDSAVKPARRPTSQGAAANGVPSSSAHRLHLDPPSDPRQPARRARRSRKRHGDGADPFSRLTHQLPRPPEAAAWQRSAASGTRGT